MTEAPRNPAGSAAVPISTLGLPEVDPEICEINADVDRLGIVHAELTSEDPGLVERHAR